MSFKHTSENKLDKIKRSKDAEKYWEEFFEEMSEREKRKFWKYLEDEHDIFHPQNQRKMRKAQARANAKANAKANARASQRKKGE